MPPKPTTPRRPTQAEQHEATALSLKNDGYNGGTVARKMIEEHGMADADAEALVSRLYGKKVNSQAGESTVAILGGFGIAGAGLLGILFLYLVTGFAGRSTIYIGGPLTALVFAGLVRAFIAMVNSGVKEDINPGR